MSLRKNLSLINDRLYKLLLYTRKFVFYYSIIETFIINIEQTSCSRKLLENRFYHILSIMTREPYIFFYYYQEKCFEQKFVNSISVII